MVSITAKSTYFKELLFPFFKIYYALIVHYVVNFVFTIGKQPYRDVINFESYIHVAGCALNARPLAPGDWDFLWATGSCFTGRPRVDRTL